MWQYNRIYTQAKALILPPTFKGYGPQNPIFGNIPYHHATTNRTIAIKIWQDD